MLPDSERLVFYDSLFAMLCTALGANPATGEAVATTARERKAIAAGSLDADLLAALKGWRKRTARETQRTKKWKRPIYYFISNAALEAVAREKPTTLDDLQKLSGFGPHLTEHYGKEILAIVKKYPTAKPMASASSRAFDEAADAELREQICELLADSDGLGQTALRNKLDEDEEGMRRALDTLEREGRVVMRKEEKWGDVWYLANRNRKEKRS